MELGQRRKGVDLGLVREREKNLWGVGWAPQGCPPLQEGDTGLAGHHLDGRAPRKVHGGRVSGEDEWGLRS